MRCKSSLWSHGHFDRVTSSNVHPSDTARATDPSGSRRYEDATGAAGDQCQSEPLSAEVRLSATDRTHYKQMHKSFTRWMTQSHRDGMWPWSKVQPTWESFLRQAVPMQRAMLHEWSANSRCHKAVVSWARFAVEQKYFKPKHGITSLVDAQIQSKSLLLTYQGDFGLFPDECAAVSARTPAEAAFRGSGSLATNLMHGNRHATAYLHEVCAKVRATPRYQTLQLQFEQFVTDLAESKFVTAFAWSLEVCSNTLFVDGLVRVHGHVYFHKTDAKIRFRDSAALAFQECRPHVSARDTFNRNRSSTTAAGLFYTCCEGKYGQLSFGSSQEPHKDFVVQPQWVLNLLGMGKLSASAARNHMVMQCRDLPRLLCSMDKYVEERRSLSLLRHQDEVQRQLNALKRPFVTIPEVSQWLDEHKLVRWRYRFLVLQGKSMLGKTRYSMSLVPDGRALELNCISGNEPDLRAYDPTETDLILFDEMPASAILGQKKLMQWPPAMVSLGTSATNAFAYKVWVHQKLFVVSTNTWYDDLEDLQESDREWLEKNALVIHVTEPLWQ